MTIGVLCAARGSDETLVVRSVGASVRVEVVRRCADLAELLASAAAGLGRVAVISPDLPGFDREAVTHLHGSGTWVVLLTDPAAGWPAGRTGQMGADVVVEAPVTEQTLGRGLQQVLAAVDAGEVPGAARTTPDGSPATPLADPAGADGAVRGDLLGRLASRGRPHVERADQQRGDEVDHRAAPSAAAPAPARPPGRLVAVWGPTGAPGRTTVALNLAAELAGVADGRGGALLVDADTYGGTVAQMLGLLDEAPGIAAAARSAATGRLDARTLASLAPVLAGGLRVLTGISRADRWTELPTSSLETLWQASRALAAWTVVDCGFSVEQDEELVYDTRAPRRNAATLSALAEADVVVAVGGGDPIGLQRLVRALGHLTDLSAPTSSRHVVVNRVRASASGPRPGEAIHGALRRYAGVQRAHLVPDDPAACDGAVLAACTLEEHAPASAVRRSLLALAGALDAEHAPAGAH